MEIYTVGHSNRSLDALVGLLEEAGVRCLADVRSRPGSGRFPWFNMGPLERRLEQQGMRYAWEGEALGGRRPASPADHRHPALAEGYRAFAGHMETAEFRAGIGRLLALAGTGRTAFLCAEKDPAHCHRSLIADHLTVRGHAVLHFIGPGKTRRHALHPAARVEGYGLVYGPPCQPDLFASDPV